MNMPGRIFRTKKGPEFGIVKYKSFESITKNLPRTREKIIS
jgi:hypothetical protein